VTFTPNWLIEQAGEAADAPRNQHGEPLRHEVLRTVKAELEVLWADLAERLPMAAEADLGQATAAGRDFRGAMARLWSALCTGEQIKKTGRGTDPLEEMLVRASLLQKVRKSAEPYLKGQVAAGRREKWRTVQPSLMAWWRPGTTREGEVTIWLGMRWQLASQTRVELPGVKDQGSLNELGEKFGVLDPDPPVSRKLTGGTDRLAVLSVEFTQGLLGEPDDGPEVSFGDSVTE
jgi:hypothetical protein